MFNAIQHNPRSFIPIHKTDVVLWVCLITAFQSRAGTLWHHNAAQISWASSCLLTKSSPSGALQYSPALLALTFSKLSALHSPPERVCCSDLRRGKHLSANSNHIIQPPTHTLTHSHTVAMVSLFGYQRAWQRGFNQPTTLYLSLWMQATRKRRQAGLITRRQSGALLCDWLEVVFCCCFFSLSELGRTLGS